jgi:hypothetical protein
MPDVLKTVGRYELLSEIGRGGMGIVYRARQLDLDRVVAVKELAGLRSAEPGFAQRFLREARVAGSLSHPNIVTVHDYLEDHGTPYIAMDYLERGTFRPFVGHLTLSRIGGALEGVLSALTHAEARGIVHRDLKPENLLVTSEGRVRITDFGLAWAAASMTWPSSDTGVAVGTPAYMAPEQAMAQPVGPWTDLYSVGCMAFELFTGRVPFYDSDAPMAILLRQVNEPIPPVHSVNPEVGTDISYWVEQLLQKHPEKRTRSADDAWDDLEEILIGLLGPRWRRSARLGAAPEGVEAGDPDSDEFKSFAWGAAPPAVPARDREPYVLTIEEAAVSMASGPPAPDPTELGQEPLAAASARHRDTGAWTVVPPPGPPEPVIVRRTPHLDVSPQPPLQPGSVFEVAVYADELAARPGEDTEDVVLRAPAEMTSFRLDVWLVATHHFLITDSPIRTIVVRRDEPKSEVATFRVAVVASLAEADKPVISASFSYDGRPSGRVTRVVAIVGAAASAAPERSMTSPTLEVDVRADAPDLVMEISAPENDGRRFDVRIDTPLLSLERRTESWFLPTEAPALVDAAMRQFFAPDQGRAARLRSLEGAGLEFYDTAPTLFKDAYWQLVDAGRKPRTMLIVSDEPSIPWELAIPYRRRPDGEHEVHRPLGTEVAIGRWHRQSGVSPRQHVPLRTSYVVAPEYQRSARLAHAAEEAEFVCSRFSGRCIEPARFDHLDLTLGDQGVDLLHFVCHGESDESGTQLLLLEEPDVLNSRQVRAMPGLSKACRQSRPMVFLNACEVGRPARGLVGTSGFAKSFIDIDASCVVGALWSVDDRIAHQVAVEFYEQILSDSGMPFAEALRRMRGRGYAEDGDDSYAAYCFYGDPAARSP